MPQPSDNQTTSLPPPPAGFTLVDGSSLPPPPAGYTLLGQTAPPEPKTLSGFANNLVSSAGDFAHGVYGAATHPIDTLVGLAKLGLGMIASKNPKTAEEFPESTAVANAFGQHFKDRYGSWDDVKNTAYKDPVGFAADASVVLDGAGALAKGLGTAADVMGAARGADALNSAGEAAQNAAGWVNPMTAPFKAGGAALTGAAKRAVNGISSDLSAEQQAAITAANDRGVPLDAATATGNDALAGTKALLERQPLSAKPLAKFKAGTQAAMDDWGSDLSDQISPTATGGSASRVATGTNLVDQFKDAIGATGDFQNSAYERLRRIAAQNSKTVPIGTTASPVLGPTGAPVITPVMQTIEGPTSYAAAKAALKPIADSIEKTIPANQLELSPGYSLLKQILDRPDTVDLDTAIQDLSAVQNIARGNGEIPQLRSQSQGLASKATQALHSAVDQATAAMGPDAVSALQQGRELTRQKYALRDTLSSFRNEPAQSIDALVQPRDRSINALTQVSQQAPQMVPDIARSVVSSILDKASSRPDSALTQWSNLGDQTKQVLFAHDPSLIDQLDNFFTAASMIGKNPNPSGSGTLAALAATGGLLVHNPPLGAAVLIGSRKLAKMMTDPATVARLNQALKMPVSSPSAPATSSLLRSLARGAGRAQRLAVTAAPMIQSQADPNAPLPLQSPEAPQR